MDARKVLLPVVLSLIFTNLTFAKEDEDQDDNGVPNYCPKDNGMFSNPTDCATYYNCVDGTAIAMSCAPGLLFDDEMKLCNFADRVKCKSQCRGPDGMFPSQHRCDEFVLCTNNKPKVMRCKRGLYFDPNLQVCNYKDRVLCSLPGGGKQTGAGKGETDAVDMRRALTLASVRSVCPKARGLFAHADSCRKFYQCYDGEVLVKSCPEGLLFDDERSSCAHAKEVECGGRSE